MGCTAETYPLDKPVQRGHHGAALEAAPIPLVLQFPMNLLIVLQAQRRAIVFPGLAVLNGDLGKLLRGTLRKALHEGAVDDSKAGIGRLHDLDTAVDDISKSLLQVNGAAEPTHKQNSPDWDIAGRDLLLHQFDDFQDDRLEDGPQIGSLLSGQYWIYTFHAVTRSNVEMQVSRLNFKRPSALGNLY